MTKTTMTTNNPKIKKWTNNAQTIANNNKNDPKITENDKTLPKHSRK